MTPWVRGIFVWESDKCPKMLSSDTTSIRALWCLFIASWASKYEFPRLIFYWNTAVILYKVVCVCMCCKTTIFLVVWQEKVGCFIGFSYLCSLVTLHCQLLQFNSVICERAPRTNCHATPALPRPSWNQFSHIHFIIVLMVFHSDVICIRKVLMELAMPFYLHLPVYCLWLFLLYNYRTGLY